MRIGLVVIATENNAIGKGNRLLCHLPDDLKYFKSITLGKPVIMGRKTFESIGKPLPGRLNIVVTRQQGLQLPGCTVVESLAAALVAAGSQPATIEAMIIGGAEIYLQALPMADRVYLTRVHAHIDGDVFFPKLSPREWSEVARQDHPADERHAYAFSFLTLERKP